MSVSGTAGNGDGAGRGRRRPREGASVVATDFAALAAESRAAQGLPPRVIDAVFLERVARLAFSAEGDRVPIGLGRGGGASRRV